MQIKTVGIVGAGTMGGGIAEVAAVAGLDVTCAWTVVRTTINRSFPPLFPPTRSFGHMNATVPPDEDARDQRCPRSNT